MRRLRLITTILATALFLGAPLVLPLLHAHEHDNDSSSREECSVCAFSKHLPALAHDGPFLPLVLTANASCGPGMFASPPSTEPHVRGERAPPVLS